VWLKPILQEDPIPIVVPLRHYFPDGVLYFPHEVVQYCPHEKMLSNWHVGGWIDGPFVAVDVVVILVFL